MNKEKNCYNCKLYEKCLNKPNNKLFPSALYELTCWSNYIDGKG